MFAYLRRLFCVGILAVTGSLPGAVSSATAESLKVGGWTNPPVGYVDFCVHFSAECVASGSQGAETLDERRWQGLQEVNTLVNRIVIAATDLDYYGSDEVWALPQTHGDCEDYVLLKRKWLMERGWPTGSLLITVVFDEVGDGHAVLLARTDRGDFVLDNKTDSIRVWSDTPYRFVKRQSVADPNRWVSVGDPRWTTQNTAAPRR